MNDDLFARDGHLTMLSLDRYDVGELDAGARRGIESHVEDCERCRGRLRAVMVRVPAIPPRIAASRSAGSATISYLAASAGVALAAGAVLGLGSAMWPQPQPAHESAVEPAHSASSYTSVAQEYSEAPDVDVDLALRGDAVVATPLGDAWLAVVVVSADADGESAILAVLRAAHATSEAVTVPIPRRYAAEQVLAIACPAPFTLAPDDPLALEPGCTVRTTE
jgi:hypothetical protein